MRISVKDLKNHYVYTENSVNPLGKVKSVSCLKENGHIDSLLIEPLSLIPVAKRIKTNCIRNISDGKIVLSDDAFSGKSKTDSNSFLEDIQIRGIQEKNARLKKINNIFFSLETGEITEFVVRKNLFHKKETLQANKITIKNDIIYID